MLQQSRHIIVTGLWLLCATTPASATEADFDNVSVQPLEPELAAAGWQLLARSDVAATEFSLQGAPNSEQYPAEPLLRINAKNSNALIYRELTAEEQNATHLRWLWRVDQAPPITSQRRVDSDDRPVALYVGFSVKRKHLGLWTRFKRSLVSRFSGLPTGQIVTYVWGGDDPRGSHFDNPYIPNIARMKVLRDGQQPLATWFEEEIDLRGDFAEVFGYPAIRPTFIAVSADTEDTQTESLAFIRAIRFETSAAILAAP